MPCACISPPPLKNRIERWPRPESYSGVRAIRLPLVASLRSITVMLFSDGILIRKYLPLKEGTYN
jgi:hypothetical protein